MSIEEKKHKQTSPNSPSTPNTTTSIARTIGGRANGTTIENIIHIDKCCIAAMTKIKHLYKDECKKSCIYRQELCEYGHV
jgi:hypothetical protein